MGMTGMFKWFRKDTLQRDRSRQSLPPNLTTSFNNDSYRNALQEFLARRKNPDDPGYIVSPNSTATSGYEFFVKNDCDTDNSNLTINQSITEKVDNNCNISIPGIPHAHPTELIELGPISGAADLYIEVIYAEWHNTKVSLRKNAHQDSLGAVDRDIMILSQIRHQNIMLLMGTTQTVDNHLVAVCEAIDCTLYHFVHEQYEKLAIQNVIKNASSLASALQYAHMRGYVHSAINPHCVFLTPCGLVKLGGWELAYDTNKIFMEEKNYEDCLRSKIYQWQAPELFSGQKPTAATDIFGLALLTWELCTGIVPWADLSKEDVEKQYAQLNKCVSVKNYNFPGLLKTFFEVGSQIDPNDRFLDMMTITRYFQRLELQFENKELFYIDEKSEIGTDTYNNSRLSINSAPLIFHGNVSQLNESNEKLPSPIKRISPERKKVEPRRLCSRAHLINRSLDVNYMRSIGQLRENSNNHRNEKLNQKLVQSSSPIKPEVERKDSKSQKESSESEEDCNPRVEIKNLKEVLADRRRSFFSGNTTYLSSFEDDRLSKSSLLEDIKSKDYKPHKPASHTTSIEPKSNSSPSKHYSTFVRSTQSKSSKLPYSYVPGPIRDAIIQPQVLNTSSQSFFETSLWSREKSSICSSKSKIYNSMLSENKSSISPDSDQTYTVTSPVEHIRQGNSNLASVAELSTDQTAIRNMNRSSSLQALKATLERVTNLVKLNSSNTTDKIEYPTSVINNSKKCNDFNPNNSKANESAFENLYGLNENIDEKIKTIERSSGQRYFTVNLKKTPRGSEKKSPTEEVGFSHISDSFTPKSIQERPRPTSVELKTALECGLPITRNAEEYNVIERRYKTKTLNTPTDTSVQCITNNENDKKFNFLNINKKVDENQYSLHSEIILARRRSLPPNLGDLKRAGSDFYINQGNKDTDLNDSVVEDFYIDDEFNENCLAPNMILMDKDSTLDSRDIFSDTPENYFGTL